MWKTAVDVRHCLLGVQVFVRVGWILARNDSHVMQNGWCLVWFFPALPCGVFVLLAPSRLLLLLRRLLLRRATSSTMQHHQQHNTTNTTSSTQYPHDTINTTPPTQHHQHNIINTTPSTQHHQHNIINTTPSTQHHQHNTISTTPSTQHQQHNTINTSSSTRHHLHNIISTTPSTLHHEKQPQCHFAWQVQHSEHLQRGPRKSGDAWVLWTPAAFAWQVQHLEDLSLILRGTCSTHSISVSFCVPLAALRAPDLQRGPRKFGDDSVFWTPAAFGWKVQHSDQCHFAGQVQHSEHLQRVPRKPSDDWVQWTPAAFAWQVQHLEHLSCCFAWQLQHSEHFQPGDAKASLGMTLAWQVQHWEDLSLTLLGRCGTWSISVSLCVDDSVSYAWQAQCHFRVAGAALGASQCHFTWHAQHSEHLQRSAEVRRRLSTAGCFCVAGAVPGAPQFHYWERFSERFAGARRRLSRLDAGCPRRRKHSEHLSVIFAWQVQHSERLQRGPRKPGDGWVLWTPAAFAWQVQHLEDLSLILRGRCSTWRTSVWFCVAGAAFGHRPCGQKLPSHIHYTSQFGALLVSQPSYSFCFIPPDTRLPVLFFLVVDCSLFCFVDLIPPLDVRRHCWHAGLSGPLILPSGTEKRISIISGCHSHMFWRATSKDVCMENLRWHKGLNFPDFQCLTDLFSCCVWGLETDSASEPWQTNSLHRIDDLNKTYPGTYMTGMEMELPREATRKRQSAIRWWCIPASLCIIGNRSRCRMHVMLNGKVSSDHSGRCLDMALSLQQWKEVELHLRIQEGLCSHHRPTIIQTIIHVLRLMERQPKDRWQGNVQQGTPLLWICRCIDRSQQDWVSSAFSSCNGDGVELPASKGIHFSTCKEWTFCSAGARQLPIPKLAGPDKAAKTAPLNTYIVEDVSPPWFPNNLWGILHVSYENAVLNGVLNSPA